MHVTYSISLKLSAVKSILATVLFYRILLAEVNDLNITLFFFEGVVVFIKNWGCNGGRQGKQIIDQSGWLLFQIPILKMQFSNICHATSGANILGWFSLIYLA